MIAGLFSRLLALGSAAALMLVLLAGYLLVFVDPVGPEAGRLNRSCHRADEYAADVHCKDPTGVGYTLDVDELTGAELDFLRRLEDFRVKRDELREEWAGKREDAPDDGALRYPYAEEESTTPIGPLLAAGVGGVLVLGLAAAAFFVFGDSFTDEESEE
ncbi:MAG: hypothetical protein AAF211_23690 [Myxococcota bacterium]